MEIDFRTTEWLTPVGIDDKGDPLFEMRPHRVATADIGLPDGQMYSHWMPLHVEPTADLLEMVDRELGRAVHEAAKIAATQEP